MRSTTVKLDDEAREILNRLVVASGTTQSEVVRNLLKAAGLDPNDALIQMQGHVRELQRLVGLG